MSPELPEPGSPGPISFPVYIPTKGRPERQHTAKMLLALGISPTLVVQFDEVEWHREHNPACRVIPWEQKFYDEYEHTPELLPNSPTTGAAHNYAWHDARLRGFTHHWIMDDNIFRLNVADKGTRHVARVPDPLTWVETWALKWQNLAGVALAQVQFMRGASTRRPFIHNTKLYCATLYRNDLHKSGLVWRRGLNDDTIFSLDLLKAGWCTAVNQRVGIEKQATGKVKGGKIAGRTSGGMSDVYLKAKFEGKMSELVRLHPDCCRPSERFGRMHHHCNYSRFTQKLVRIPDADYWTRIDLSER